MFKLGIIPLGGLGRIGGNMMAYETPNDLIIIDCGLQFPSETEPGVDWLVPDWSYLEDRKEKLRGYIITHGHLDHFGALPFVVEELPAPIFASEFTLAMIRQRLEDHGQNGDLRILRDGADIPLGDFLIEAIPVTHSIPGSVALALKTPIGTLVHTGDFKIDPAPFDGRSTDLHRLEQLGKEGVVALLSDSTNATKPGHTPSEKEVATSLSPLIKNAPFRVVITTFSSNVFRLQTIIRAAKESGRKVIPLGRSVRQILNLSVDQGLIKVPSGFFAAPEDIETLPASRICVLAAGCQGEPRSAMGRIVAGQYPSIQLNNTDRVIFSSPRIPGNERPVGEMVNTLLKNGIEVIEPSATNPIHASGHAQNEEQVLLMKLCRPRFLIPLHGEMRHMHRHADLAKQEGIETLVTSDGNPLVLEKKEDNLNLRRAKTIPAGFRYFQNDQEIDPIILLDRTILSRSGFVACSLSLSPEGRLLGEPMLDTRGIFYVDHHPELRQGAIEEIKAAFSKGRLENSWESVHDRAKQAIKRYFRRELKMRPLIVITIHGLRDD